MSLLEGYDVIAFDCDGVLLDSNKLKTRLFRDVLAANGFPPHEIAAFTAFQNVNFGTSRYRLLAAAAEGKFGEKRDVTADHLIAEFGIRCRIGYLEEHETPGLRDALNRAGAHGRPLYVASGSDEDELRDVFHKRDLTQYFRGIYGSPTTKADNLRRIRANRMADGGHEGERYLFVGDAFADMRAAAETGYDFLFMAGFSTVRETLSEEIKATSRPFIEDLRELT